MVRSPVNPPTIVLAAKTSIDEKSINILVGTLLSDTITDR